MQHRIAAFGITLAIASTALWAAPGDAWYGTGKDEDKVHHPPLEAAPAEREPTISYDERRTVLASRDELAPERYETREYMAQAPAARDPNYDPRHPQTGQLIGRGLFNRVGPNDFGA
jgi:hypothetical protein